MRRAAPTAAVVLLALAGCRPEQPTTNDAQIAETIANIAEERPVAKQDRPPPALAAIAQPDAERALAAGAACDFTEGGRLVFVSGPGDAIGKVDGQSVRFAASGPTGAPGGFWVTDRYSVSIGRAADDGVRAGETTSWPARLVLTDRRRDENSELRLAGTWRCRG
jgi:hypothetical protein